MSTERPAPGEPPIRAWLRIAWLAGLVYAVASSTQVGASGRHLEALVLTTTTGIGWAGWLGSRHWRNDTVSAVSLVVLGASGGVITATLSHFGIVIVGVAAMCAASLFELTVAAAIASAGVVAAAIGYAAQSSTSATSISNAASGAVAGLFVGLGRRQQHERSWREAELALAQQRTEVEHERAEVLAERNRIAREVHDVLAHTLSALAVQMEALDAMVAGRADQTQVRQTLNRSRQLAITGLEETRQAVQALRDEPVAVADQISAAAAASDADFAVAGDARPLTAAHGLALLRVAQEALTNARKHAPRATVAVTLEFQATSVRLTVANGPAVEAESALGSSGGGFGLRGIRERVELLGGRVMAGPEAHGEWVVRVELPT